MSDLIETQANTETIQEQIKDENLEAASLEEVFKSIDKKTYSTAIQASLDDLVSLYNTGDIELFKELYYSRVNTFKNLYESLLLSLEKTSKSILLSGSAGIGKTSMLIRLKMEIEQDHLLKDRIYSVFIDYRNEVPGNIQGCLIKFISELKIYFNEHLKYPLKSMYDNTPDNITINLQEVLRQFKYLDGIKYGYDKKLVLILDDFDYAESEWYALLDHFLPFCDFAVQLTPLGSNICS
ncbi:ATP-binding protein [Deferribacteres bacterium DY0037]